METASDWVTTCVRAVKRYGADSPEVARLVEETVGERARALRLVLLLNKHKGNSRF